MIRRQEVTSRQVVEAHIAAPRAHRAQGARRSSPTGTSMPGRPRTPPTRASPPPLRTRCFRRCSACRARSRSRSRSRACRTRPGSARRADRRRRAGRALPSRRLIEAGAIPLGVTNTSELCLWIEARNQVYGDSNNPYDVTRTVGGSSGGEGAVIGSGGTPFGLGSDLAGSIRVPAFCCGVFGHKPSVGVVPTSGPLPDRRGPVAAHDGDRADRPPRRGPHAADADPQLRRPGRSVRPRRSRSAIRPTCR